MKEIWACVKCGVAFPEMDEAMKKEFVKCPYCQGELKLHELRDPIDWVIDIK